MLGIHWAGLDLSPSGKSRETHLQGGQLLERLLPPPRAGRRCSDSRASEPVGQEGFPGGRTGGGGGWVVQWESGGRCDKAGWEVL